MSLTPAERRLRSSIAGLSGWANTTDRAARGRAGHDGLMRKFEREEREEHPSATDAEIHKRAATRYRLHMAKLTAASLKARKAKAEQRDQQAAAMKAARDKRTGAA
jgi:hypothetical protein